MKGAGRLRELYGEPLLRFAYGYLRDEVAAEVVVREVFLRALEGDEEPDRARPWLYRIARNLCLNQLRDGARRGEGRLRTAFDAAESGTGALTRLLGAERDAEVNAWLAQLSTEHQEVLRLRYAEDLSRAEIAEVLQIPPSLVKTRLYEGVRRLRALASDHESGH
ncbi:MAG: sigma-70 family RNA polymerase sigma factor [Planctomycetes bacterium]|nr:sigma-70 family RNA polymerase sigma factor [Planctomycetota bacterium]MCB9905167.1 sigma-70 family RNA polymerase sigma factor [Planctomycetota bacterium]